MKVGLIIEGLAAGYCCFCWIRDRPQNGREFLRSLGKRLPVRKKESFGLWILLTILCGGFVLAAFAVPQPQTAETGLDALLRRPAYGEADQNMTLEVEARQNDQSLERTITVVIPDKDPEPAQIQNLLTEAQNYVQAYFRDYAEKDGNWPTRYQEATIICTSLDKDLIDPAGRILWEAVKEQETARIQVVISAFGQTRTQIVTCLLDPREYTLEEQIDRVASELEKGTYLTQEGLELPSGNDRNTTFLWRKPRQEDHSRLLFAILLVGVMPILVVLARSQRSRTEQKKRQAMIGRRCPDMLNKIMILLGSGMSLVRAWETITGDYLEQQTHDRVKEPLYEEMLLAQNRFHNGISFSDAIKEFADRSQVKEIRQFVSILQTSWKRGDEHVLTHLRELHDRSWETRRNETRKMSEEADTKLLMPLMMMLVVVMIIVLTPAMMTMTI